MPTHHTSKEIKCLCSLLETRLLQAVQNTGDFTPLPIRVERLEGLVNRLEEVQSHYRHVQGGYEEAAVFLTELSLRYIQAYTELGLEAGQAKSALARTQTRIHDIHDSMAVSEGEARQEHQRLLVALEIEEALLGDREERALSSIEDYRRQLFVVRSKAEAMEALLKELAECVASAALLLDYLLPMISLYSRLHALASDLQSQYPGSQLASLEQLLLRHYSCKSIDEQPHLSVFLRLHCQLRPERLTRVQHCLRLLPALLDPAFQAVSATDCLRSLLDILSSSNTQAVSSSKKKGEACKKKRTSKTQLQKWSEEVAHGSELTPAATTKPALPEEQREALENWLREHDATSWRSESHESRLAAREKQLDARLSTQRKRKRLPRGSNTSPHEPILQLQVLPEREQKRVRLYSDHEALLQNVETRVGRQIRDQLSRFSRDLARSCLRTTCKLRTPDGTPVPVEVELISDFGMTVITPEIFEQRKQAKQCAEAHNRGVALHTLIPKT